MQDQRAGCVKIAAFATSAIAQATNFVSLGDRAIGVQKLAGIFLSYSRADRDHAYRIVQGLRTLGVHVWWDEDMPGVDWQYELEQQITDMAAVLVLWSKNSRKSKSVRDEARLADRKDKLINALIDGVEPPAPFDRINGLPIDGWDGREPHRGWSLLVQTVESFIAATGAAESGKIMAELAKVAQDWQGRKQEFALAQEAFDEAHAAEADAADAAAAAAAELANAQKQLGKAGEMGFPIEVLGAAKEVCDAKATVVAEADAAHRVATAKLAEASRNLKRCTYALQQPARELPAEPIAPAQFKPLPPELASATDEKWQADDERKAEEQRQADAGQLEPDRIEREQLENERRLAEAERQAEIARKQSDERAERYGESEARAKRLRLETESNAQRQEVRHRKWKTFLKGVLSQRNAYALLAIAVVAPIAIVEFSQYQVDTLGSNGQELVEITTESQELAPPTPPLGEWLIGEWVIDQKDVCAPLLVIARGKGANELTFTIPNSDIVNAPDTFTIEIDGTLVTSSWRYRLQPTGGIRRQEIKYPNNVQELTACRK